MIFKNSVLRWFWCACLIIGLASCSSDKFLAGEQRILSDVKLKIDNKHVKHSDMRTYVRQEPNSKWFNWIKIPLGIYCISGTDSTKRVNRFFRRIGEAPVIYDENQTRFSTMSLENALQGKGYLQATVETEEKRHGKKIRLTYHLHTGRLYYVDRISHEFDSPVIRSIVMQDSAHSMLYKGMPLDVSILETERKRIISLLHDKGYYRLSNNYITFSADTIPQYNSVSLTVHFSMPPGVDSAYAYKVHRFAHVRVIDNNTAQESQNDSTTYRQLTYVYHRQPRLNKRVYNRNIHIRPDSIFSEQTLQNTYGSLNSLPPIRSTSIQLRPSKTDPTALDADIYLWYNKKNNISAELEGTNTAGDLGAAVSLSYSNNSIFRGAEVFNLKLRGAYEAISKLEGYSRSNYLEYNIESGIQFPTLMLPFVPYQTKQSLKASSEISFQYNLQNRPEFHRRVATAAWTYKWNRLTDVKAQHRWDVFSLDYIFMPWISDTFRKNYLEDDDSRNSVIRYSYEDLFVMKTSYGFVYNSSRRAMTAGLDKTNAHQIRVNVELAGNVLYAISKAARFPKNSSGQYALFNIAYSQYAKLDFDLTKNFLIDDRNAVVFHLGLGVGIPYGNSTILPYEKRYFSGGANSVRGWSTRSLGPGRYVGKDGNVDFINQTGNLKLDLNLEYRTHLFWKFDAAAYIDAGNIWNTRAYKGIENGLFRFDSFYKQIAVSYGLGLRLNFDYFILRFDTGMKAINPAVESGRKHFPIICPDFGRDFAFHFAVGLPF